jgi:hypothetical protein
LLLLLILGACVWQHYSLHLEERENGRKLVEENTWLSKTPPSKNGLTQKKDALTI